MAARDSFYTPALSRADALAMAREDGDALVRRHVVDEDMDGWRDIVQQIADAYTASNLSTIRAIREQAGYEVTRAVAAGWYARGVEAAALTAELAQVQEQLAAIRQVADGAVAAAIMEEMRVLRATIDVIRRAAPHTLASAEATVRRRSA